MIRFSHQENTQPMQISGLEGTHANLALKEIKKPTMFSSAGISAWTASTPKVPLVQNDKKPWGANLEFQASKKNLDLLQQRSDGTIVSILNPKAVIPPQSLGPKMRNLGITTTIDTLDSEKIVKLRN